MTLKRALLKDALLHLYLPPLFSNISSKKVEQDMLALVDGRNSFGDSHDDLMGGIPILVAYVDNVNCLLHPHDVKPFLDSFKRHGKPLGAIMNTEKTQILTSTDHNSVRDRFLSSSLISDTMTGSSLKEAIKLYLLKPHHRVSQGIFEPCL